MDTPKPNTSQDNTPLSESPEPTTNEARQSGDFQAELKSELTKPLSRDFIIRIVVYCLASMLIVYLVSLASINMAQNRIISRNPITVREQTEEDIIVLDTSDWIEYTDSRMGITLLYPGDWALDDVQADILEIGNGEALISFVHGDLEELGITFGYGSARSPMRKGALEIDGTVRRFGKGSMGNTLDSLEEGCDFTGFLDDIYYIDVTDEATAYFNFQHVDECFIEADGDPIGDEIDRQYAMWFPTYVAILQSIDVV